MAAGSRGSGRRPGAAAAGILLSADADRYAYEEPALRGRIIGTLDGHAAEQLVWTNATSTTRNLDATPVDP